MSIEVPLVQQYIDHMQAHEPDVITDRGFSWLMEHLLSPSPSKIKGCELVFPDTVWFNQKGFPYLIIRNDRDFCLMAVKSHNKLRNESIY